MLNARITSRDQVMPLFALDTMGQYPGLCGLFVSGIFSASLSTISSAVTSLSAVTLEDYVKPVYRIIFKRTLIDSKSTLPTKIIACIYGLLCIVLAFGAGSLGGALWLVSRKLVAKIIFRVVPFEKNVYIFELRNG
ncbi:hypothetical protein ACLKA6_001997 [Drosophila palustris]